MLKYQDEEVRNYQIYIHQNKINGKLYCGQTCNTLEHRAGHNGLRYNDSPRFHNAIQKYGWDNFNHFTLIDGLTHEEANIVETQIIRKYNLTDDRYGYNINEGGSHSGKPIENLVGRKFGRLTVLHRDCNRSGIYWICECSCEEHNIVSVCQGSLLSGATKSCGCLKKEVNRISHAVVHGMSKSKLYEQWRNMIKRIDAKDNVINEWYDFKSFLAWAKQTGYKEGDVIIRKNTDLQYSPDNCYWGTQKEYKLQAARLYKSIFYEYNGKNYTAKELSDLSGIPLNALNQRLRNNSFDTIEKALFTPYRHLERIQNTYESFDDYTIIHIPDHDVYVDNKFINNIKEHIWVYKDGSLIEKLSIGKRRLHLLSLILDIQERHMKRLKINYKNGNCFDLRLSNMELIIPDVDDYLYYIAHIDVNGIVLEKRTWRIGKTKESRKSFQNFAGALKYYDDRYGTALYDEFKNHSGEQQLDKTIDIIVQ